MAARKPKSAASSLFALAERQIVGIYDAGVMSPAVLHHVVAAYAESGIDWSEEGALKTVDGHTVQEAVVLIMMPGRALRTAKKDFRSVVEHLTGISQSPADNPADDEAHDDEDLLSQLGGTAATPSNSRAAKKSTPASEPKRAAFNPLVGARAMRKT